VSERGFCDALRTCAEFVGFVQGEEKRLHHGGRFATREQAAEIASFDAQSAVDIELRSFVDAREDRTRSRIVTPGFLAQHRICADECFGDLGILRRAAGELERLIVPRSFSAGMSEDPSAGCRDEIGCGHQLVDEADFLRSLEPQTFTFEQQWERRHDADEARNALRAAAARQEPEGDFRASKARVRLRDADAAVAGERDLGAAAERGAGQRRDEGFSAGFHAAGQGVKRVDIRIEFRDALGADFVQVETHDEVALRRRHDRADGARIREHALHGRGELRHALRIQNVHATRHRPRERDDPGRIPIVGDELAHTSSTIVAMPIPPPTHNVTRPTPRLRRSSSSMSDPISMAPVAPSGWPSAIAPPLTLTRS